MKYLIVLLFSVFIFGGCSPSEQEQAQQQQREHQMQMQLVETNPQFNEQLNAVLDLYFELKDALVNSDAGLAKEHAAALLNETGRVEPAGLNEETAAVWGALSEVIINRSDELILQDDVDDQRYHFEYISDSAIQMVDLFRPLGYEVFHQSCPMVRGGSAGWLSRDEQIANPYHGERMLQCGEIIRRI